MSQFAERRSSAFFPCCRTRPGARPGARARVAVAGPLAVIAAVGLAGTVHAQDGGGASDGLPPVADLISPAEPFRLELGYEYQDDTKFSGSQARFGVQRVDLDLGYDTETEGGTRVALELDYDLNIYDFKRGGPFAEEWEDIHEIALSARFEADLNNDLVLYGGPVLAYSGESGADFGDALTGGGFAGLSWRPDDDLILGLGFAVVSQIEDSARIIPLIDLQWEFTEGFWLRATPTSLLTGGTEVQLAWEVDRDFVASLGLMLNSKRRFLLDDEGAVADGVGLEEGRWLYLRGTWVVAPNADFTASVGLALSPDLTLDDADGNELGKASYDEVLSIGATFSLRF